MVGPKLETTPLPNFHHLRYTTAPDDYGHLLRSTTTTFEGESTTVVHRKSAAFFHAYDPFISGVGTPQLTDDRWLLGRMVRSRSVEERRRDATLVTGSARWASFSYDSTSGLLQWERTQDASANGSFASARFSTHHQYDAFGNRVQSTVCSPEVGEAVCAATSASTLNMVPSSNTRIQRYTRWTFDALGRFPVATLKPYFGPSGTTVERSEETIRSWNEMGQPTRIDGINGAVTTIAYGNTLREWFRKSNAGPWTQSIHARCTGTQTAPFCPAQAATRVETRTGGGATIWTYLDVLGRPQLELRQHDATRFVAVRTHYDGKRPVTTPCPASRAVATSRAQSKEVRDVTGVEAGGLGEAGSGVRAQRAVAAGVVRRTWLERVFAGRMALPAAA